MPLSVRKVVSHLETTMIENGQKLEHLHKVAVVAAVIQNPYPAGFNEDVSTIAHEIATELGSIVGPPVVDLLGDPVEAFGKGALIGIEGELEEGSALIHNLIFGNVFRNAAQGTELLPAAEKIGHIGSQIDLALKHKTDAKTRSHHQTFSFSIADAPRPREIVVMCCAANAGRPLARLAAFGTELT